MIIPFTEQWHEARKLKEHRITQQQLFKEELEEKKLQKSIEEAVKRIVESEESIATISDIVTGFLEVGLQEHKQQQAAKQKARMDSSVPFIDIISEKHDSEHGLEIKMDWNAAFINELKANGYTGDDEEAMVHKWLGTLRSLTVDSALADKDGLI